jgi:hypothetical protein
MKDPVQARIEELTDKVVTLKALLRRAKVALNGVQHIDNSGICKETIRAIEKELIHGNASKT